MTIPNSSEYTEYHGNDGVLVSRVHIPSGVYEVFYPNGNIKERTRFECGEPDGKHESWHENGNLWETAFYIKGEIEGEHKLWYENGQLCLSEFYRNGQQDGEFKSWYSNGLMRCRAYYKEGHIEGEFKEWNSGYNKTYYSYHRETRPMDRLFTVKKKQTILNLKKQFYNRKLSISSFLIPDLKNIVRDDIPS